MSRYGLPALVMALAVLGSAGPAGAVDGVIEINQTSALAGGVNGSLVTDPAGFPVSITQPGSYRLTGDLTVPNASVAAAVDIRIGEVTLDLGGFTIRGSNTVSGTVCSAAGTAAGIISAGGPASHGVVVRDGRVVGMNSNGVVLNSLGGRIERMLAKDNCGAGFAIQDEGGFVLDSQAFRNAGVGISTTSRVRDSWAQNNGGAGIRVDGTGAVVTGSMSSGNNTGIQFSSGGGVAIGNAVIGNQGFGIAGGNGVAIINNTVMNNTGYGVGGSGDGVGSNVFRNNDAGASYPFAIGIGCNIVDAILYCPSHP